MMAGMQVRNGATLFVFSRRLLSPPADASESPDDLTWLPSVDDTPDEPVASSTEEDGSRPSDPPVVRAVLGYLPHFNRHRRAAHKIAQASLDRVRAAEVLVERLEWQTKGLAAAEENLRDSVKAVRQRFQAFHRQYNAQRPSQKGIIQRTPESVEKLKQCTLHPLLQRPGPAPTTTTTTTTTATAVTTLADSVPVDRVDAWAQECATAGEAIDRYVSELEESWTALHEGALEEASAPPLSLSTQDRVKSILRDLTRSGEEQRDGAEAVEEEADEGAAHAREAADHARREQMRASGGSSAGGGASSSSTAVEEVVFLDKVHQKLSTDTLPSMTETDRHMMRWLEQLADVARTQHREAIRRLRNVARLQTDLHSLQIRGVEVDAAQKVQSAAVADLRHVAALPQSYRSAVAEVIRRRAWGRQYLRRMERMADNLARFRAHEVQHRDAFLREHGPHLPPNLIPGLPERPPHVELRCRVFDDALPAIDSDKELEALLEVEGAVDDEAEQGDDEEEADEDEKEEGGEEEEQGGGGEAAKQEEEEGEGSPAEQSSRHRRRRKRRRRRDTNGGEASDQRRERRSRRPAASPSSSDVDSAEAHRAAMDKAMEDDEDKKLALESENARLRGKVADLERLLGLFFEPGTVPGSPSQEGVSLPSSAEMRRRAIQMRSQTDSDAAKAALGFEAAPGRRRSYADVARGPPPEVGSPSRWGPLRTPSEAALAHVVQSADAALHGQAAPLQEGGERETDPPRDDVGAASASATDRSKAEAAGLAVVAMASRRDSSAAAATPTETRRNAISPEPSASPSRHADASLALHRSHHTLPTAAQLAVQELVAAFHTASRDSEAQRERIRELESMVQHRIAFRGFRVGDVALFLASGYGDDSKPVYTAFNEGAPRRYLSYESLPAFRGRRGQFPASLVGRIVAVDQCTVPEDDPGNVALNPFRLRGGTVFYSLTAERLPRDNDGESDSRSRGRNDETASPPSRVRSLSAHGEGAEEEEGNRETGLSGERRRSSSNGAQRKRKSRHP